jgi:hypothetical protein
MVLACAAAPFSYAGVHTTKSKAEALLLTWMAELTLGLGQWNCRRLLPSEFLLLASNPVCDPDIPDVSETLCIVPQFLR